MAPVSSGFSLKERRAIETDGQGNIRYLVYGQDGRLVPMLCADTPSNRAFVLWLRQFDRFTGARDSDRHPDGPRPQGSGSEATRARAEGIAQPLYPNTEGSPEAGNG